MFVEAVRNMVLKPEKWRSDAKRFKHKPSRATSRVMIRDEYSQRMTADQDIDDDRDELFTLKEFKNRRKVMGWEFIHIAVVCLRLCSVQSHLCLSRRRSARSRIRTFPIILLLPFTTCGWGFSLPIPH